MDAAKRMETLRRLLEHHRNAAKRTFGGKLEFTEPVLANDGETDVATYEGSGADTGHVFTTRIFVTRNATTTVFVETISADQAANREDARTFLGAFRLRR
jgi:hypothetical protein